MDLIRFIRKNSVPLTQMMKRAGMSETDIYSRTRDVFLHYKLPYDAVDHPTSPGTLTPGRTPVEARKPPTATPAAG